MSEKNPTAAYQCVSRPGSCKFEWCCGPLTECHIIRRDELAGTAQEKKDIKEAERRQARWRRSLPKGER